MNINYKNNLNDNNRQNKEKYIKINNKLSEKEFKDNINNISMYKKEKDKNYNEIIEKNIILAKTVNGININDIQVSDKDSIIFEGKLFRKTKRINQYKKKFNIRE